MKNYLLSLAAATATIGSAHAATLYTDTWTVIDTHSRDALTIGGAAPDLSFGDVFGPINGYTEGSAVTLTSNASGRSAGIWLDSDSWATGLVTVSVQISGFSGTGDSTDSQLLVYSAGTLDGSNSASLDMQTGAGPNISGQTSFVGGSDITGDGVVTFTFNNTTGTDGTAIVLKNDLNNEYTIGAIEVYEGAAVPEPTSTALLGLGALAFITRRKRA